MRASPLAEPPLQCNTRENGIVLPHDFLQSLHVLKFDESRITIDVPKPKTEDFPSFFQQKNTNRELPAQCPASAYTPSSFFPHAFCRSAPQSVSSHPFCFISIYYHSNLQIYKALISSLDNPVISDRSATENPLLAVSIEFLMPR